MRATSPDWCFAMRTKPTSACEDMRICYTQNAVNLLHVHSLYVHSISMYVSYFNALYIACLTRHMLHWYWCLCLPSSG
jgi:hypothetical protein